MHTQCVVSCWNGECSEKKYQPWKWCAGCWARIFSRFRECGQQRSKIMQAGNTEKESNQQQRVKIMTDMTRKIKAKGTMEASSSCLVIELLAADRKKCVFIQTGRTQGSDGTLGSMR